MNVDRRYDEFSYYNQEGEGEVAYVDAQRNMAVAIGERDVKTDVNIKERVRLDTDIVLSLLSLLPLCTTYCSLLTMTDSFLSLSRLCTSL